MRTATALAPLIVAGLVWMLPVPAGLEAYAWQYFAIFAGVVVALITEPVPAAMAGLVGVTLAASLNLVPVQAPATKPAAPAKAETAKPAETAKAEAPKVETRPAESAAPAVSKPEASKPDAAKAAEPAKAPARPKPADAIKWALTGFADSTVWLIFIAFMFAKGYEKTGLGRRISLALVRWLGKSSLGLGYATACADLALAPFMPSNTARSGGTVYPIIKNIPVLYGSTPENEPRKLGAYLMWTALATTTVTSSMFLTGLAPNLLALSLVQKTAGITITWTEWFLAFAPVGVPLFLVTPWLAYVLYPPTLKRSDDAPAWAGEELAKLGPLSSKEMLMALAAASALVLWIFAGDVLHGTTAALVVLCGMLLLHVITWDDVLGNKQAWNVFLWFGTLVTLADGLNKVGFLAWFAKSAAALMAGYSLSTVMVGLTVVFFVSHYLFASVTAHVTALLPALLGAALAVPGMPAKTMSVLLCASLGIMGIITPYGTGPSPIYFGSGYVRPRDFWVLGFIFGALYLGVYLLIGVPWILHTF